MVKNVSEWEQEKVPFKLKLLAHKVGNIYTVDDEISLTRVTQYQALVAEPWPNVYFVILTIDDHQKKKLTSTQIESWLILKVAVLKSSRSPSISFIESFRSH